MSIKIRGKDYVTVAERVTAAHEAGGYAILASDVLEMGATGRLYVRVQIQFNGARYIGMAEVKLTAKAGTPDGDNPLECAETSALGRALGFAGLGAVEGIASADELLRKSVA